MWTTKDRFAVILDDAMMAYEMEKNGEKTTADLWVTAFLLGMMFHQRHVEVADDLISFMRGRQMKEGGAVSEGLDLSVLDMLAKGPPLDV